MGTRFFRIAGIFSYGVAALALFITVLSLLIAVYGYSSRVDEKIETPEPTMVQFRSDIEPDEQPAQTGAEDSQTKAQQDEEPSRFDQQIEELSKVINLYAQKTQQRWADRPGLRRYLLGNADIFINDDDFHEFINHLTEAVQTELLDKFDAGDDSIMVANIPGVDQSGNSQHLDWSTFASWYADEYISQYQSELRRIEAEALEQAENRAEARNTLMFAAATFAIFILGTLVLLLVRIEQNTRKPDNS